MIIPAGRQYQCQSYISVLGVRYLSARYICFKRPKRSLSENRKKISNFRISNGAWVASILLVFFHIHDSLQIMKPLTAALILLASSPAFSCPFHGAFFLDDVYEPHSEASIGHTKGENPQTASEIKSQPPVQFGSFRSKLEQWKEEKGEQPKQLSSSTSQAPVIETSRLSGDLRQQ